MILSILNSKLLLSRVVLRKKSAAEKAAGGVGDAKEANPERSGEAAGDSGE